MRTLLIVSLLVLAAVRPEVSVAQNLPRMGEFGSQSSIPRGWGTDDTAASGHWSRCARQDPDHLEAAIRSCGRVIGERISRTASADAYFYRAEMYDDSGRREQAEADYTRALDLYNAVIRSEPLAHRPLFDRGWFYYRRGNYDGALADAAAALGAASHAPSEFRDEIRAYSHYLRGVIFFRMGKYSDAIGEQDQAASLNPEEESYHARRCEARAAAQLELDIAASACEEAIRLGAAPFTRGYLRFMAGDFQAAWEDFNTAWEDNDNSASRLFGRGVAAIRLGRTAEGQTDIETARRRGPFAVSFYEAAGLSPQWPAIVVPFPVCRRGRDLGQKSYRTLFLRPEGGNSRFQTAPPYPRAK